MKNSLVSPTALSLSLLISLITLLSLANVSIVEASARYNPGETLDPDCLPTDTTCTVASPWTTSGTNAYFNNTANVGIATTSPFFKLSINGTVGMPALPTGAGTGSICITLATGELSTSTTGCTGSSQRYKDNIKDLSPDRGLSDIMLLKPVTFTYKPELKTGTSPQIGFIAEDMVKVVPEVVGLDKDNLPANVDYAKLTPILTKAIQELNIKVDALGTSTVTHTSSQSSIFDSLKVKTATISQGLEMADQVTGQTYCVQIRNGEWSKVLGSCADAIILNTPRLTPTPIVEQTEISTTTSDSGQATTTP